MLLGLLVLGFLILNSTGELNPFEKKMRLKAQFPTADGLREGAEVELAGVHIGKIEKVRLLPPDSPADARVEAVMLIDQKLDGSFLSERIRTDSTAQMVSLSLLANDKFINITPGTVKGAPVTDNFLLGSQTATTINELTETGNELLTQLNQLATPANEILNRANRGEGTLGRIVNDESLYNNLDSTVNETRATMLRLQTTIDKVNRGEGSAGKLLNDAELYDNLNRTVAKLDAISGDLRAGRGTAGKLLSDDALYNDTRAAIADLRRSAENINGVVNDFRAITSDLQAGRGSAGKLLKDEGLYDDARATISRLNSTTEKFNLIIENAQSGKGTVGKLLTDETLYNNLNQTTANVNQITTEGTKLIYDFRQNPKKYLTVKFSIF